MSGSLPDICAMGGVANGSSRRSRTLLWLIPVLLYIVLRTGYFAFGLYWPADNKWAVHTAASILCEGDTDLDEYADLMQGGVGSDYTLERVGGEIHTIYPLGASVLAVPHVAVYGLFYRALTGTGLVEYLKDYGAGNIERLIASSFAALSVVVLYLILRRHLPVWGGLALALGYGVATSIWSTAALALWQHTPTLLLFMLTLWALDAARDRPARIQYAGLTLALAFIARPTNAITIGLVTLYVALYYRRQLWRYLAWAAPVAIAFFTYSLTLYGRLMPTYYLMRGIGNTLDLWEGLAGTLISPNRGLFVWAPVVLLAFYGIYLRVRDKTFGRLDALLVGIIALHWLLISSWVMWWGGYSMGPRFFTDVLPFYAYLTIPVLQHLPGQRVIGKALVTLLLAASVAYGGVVQYRCAATMGPAQWGADPVNVDIAPSRLWDWQDLEFMRNSGEQFEVRDGLRVGWWQCFEFDNAIPGKGWSFAERNPSGESYTWTIKKTATFYLEVRRPTDVAVRFRVINWLTAENLNSLQVRIGETPVTLERTFDEQGAAIYTGVLPAAAFETPLRYYVLTFAVDHALSPKIKDPQSTDTRKLGLAFDWISFTPLERGD